jgi:hypothetical protein
MQIVFQVHDPAARQFETDEAMRMMAAADALGYGDLARDARHQMSSRPSDLEFVPISITPRVRDTEYNFDFDSHTAPVSGANLKRIVHRSDGAVLFIAKLDDGKELGLVGATMHESPVEPYTQVLDEATMNVVMMLINDLRDDIAVAVSNLTHTEAKLEDFMGDPSKFGTDAMGRKLSYKILVKDSKVLAVLTIVGGEVKSLPFLEHSVPAMGSLITVTSQTTGEQCYGFVKAVPTGLIVTNDLRDDFEKIVTKFPRVPCSTIASRKHVADLHGYVDCEVVFKGGAWMLDSPMNESHNCTTLQLADEEVQTELFCIRESLKSEVSDDLSAIIDDIEANLAKLRGKTYSSPEEAKALLTAAMEGVKSARTIATELKAKHTSSSSADEMVEIIAKAEKALPKFERELRALRFEVAM